MKPQTAVLPGLAAMVLALLLPTASPAAEDPAPTFLTAPFLQLPEESSVRVVWFTNFEGSGHGLAYGDDLSAAAEATTIRMTRMLEDADSRLADRAFEALAERPVWRHEALATGLAPGKRVPYRVRSVTAAGQVLESDRITLKPAPQPGERLKILLTSDQQNRQMSPANFQKVVETFGKLDAVFFAGDLVDHPRRASEWFDRFDPSWRDDGPDYRRARPPFFPALQGTYRQLFPAFPYRGGEILQHAPLIGAIGNHEVSGRYRPNETVVLGGRSNLADINFMYNDPQPRWFAEIAYAQRQAEINPTGDPAIRARWIADNSFEATQYLEMWSHPAEGPAGESYYAVRLGDVFLISLNVSRIWRTWNVGERDRGKFTEPLADLDNPENWGFGEFLFERFDRHSEQYRWLRGVLRSKAFKDSRYKVVMAHQTAFGLGDNAAPVLTDPVMQVTRNLGNGRTHTLTLRQPIRPRTWEQSVARHLGSIVEVSYAYPLTRDIWKRDVEPLLRRHGVQLVLVGHSHVWNRARVGGLNYLESSNVGNSFGAYYEDELGPWRDAGRASRARSFWSELETPESRWDPKDYPPRNDPHGRAPILPTTSNPMQTMEGEARPLPFVSSNNVTVFSILDTAEGAVRSFAFDTRDPESEVVEFDRFELKSGRSRRAPY